MPPRKINDQFPNTVTLRMPDGLKAAIDKLVERLNEKLGTEITRSEFVVTAVQYYLDYLDKASTPEELKKQIEEVKAKTINEDFKPL